MIKHLQYHLPTGAGSIHPQYRDFTGVLGVLMGVFVETRGRLFLGGLTAIGQIKES